MVFTLIQTCVAFWSVCAWTKKDMHWYVAKISPTFSPWISSDITLSIFGWSLPKQVSLASNNWQIEQHIASAYSKWGAALWGQKGTHPGKYVVWYTFKEWKLGNIPIACFGQVSVLWGWIPKKWGSTRLHLLQLRRATFCVIRGNCEPRLTVGAYSDISIAKVGS